MRRQLIASDKPFGYAGFALAIGSHAGSLPARDTRALFVNFIILLVILLGLAGIATYLYTLYFRKGAFFEVNGVRLDTRDGAAILGLLSVDTIKQVERQTIVGTIPRERIVLAQTPQVFRYEIIREAFERAAADGFIGSDEAVLAERIGCTVRVLLGSDRNIKITKPSDLPLARLYIAQEREQKNAEL